MIVEQIQALCKKEKITIAQLEKKLAFGNGTIRRWDENSPSVDKILKVADHFGVSVDDLLEKTKEENK